MAARFLVEEFVEIEHVGAVGGGRLQHDFLLEEAHKRVA